MCTATPNAWTIQILINGSCDTDEYAFVLKHSKIRWMGFQSAFAFQNFNKSFLSLGEELLDMQIVSLLIKFL